MTVQHQPSHIEILSDLEYLRIAYRTAQGMSNDPSTQNGAILVDPRTGQVRVRAANRFPEGVVESYERWQKPLKLQFVEHAERNAIYAAAKQGIRTDGLTMYCPWFACADCARGIIQAGIKKVVGHNLSLHYKRVDWQASVDLAITMLKEAGIETSYCSGAVGGVAIRFAGQEVHP